MFKASPEDVERANHLSFSFGKVSENINGEMPKNSQREQKQPILYLPHNDIQQMVMEGNLKAFEKV